MQAGAAIGHGDGATTLLLYIGVTTEVLDRHAARNFMMSTNRPLLKKSRTSKDSKVMSVPDWYHWYHRAQWCHLKASMSCAALVAFVGVSHDGVNDVVGMSGYG